jgi:hypothetical protein
MRSRLLWPSTIIVALAVTLLRSAVPVALAQGPPATLTFAVTENRAPGAAGTGTITPLPGDQIRVEVRLTGMPPDSEHSMHIHIADGARCDTNAPISYPLTNVRVDAAGVGTSTTTVMLRPDLPVPAGNAYVNVHEDPTISPGVICANIDATFAAAAADQGGTPAQSSGQMPQTLARTGTGLVADTPLTNGWLPLVLLAGLVAVGTLGAHAAARRRAAPPGQRPRARG